MIPVELFTRKFRQKVESRLVRDQLIAYQSKDRALREVMKEVSPLNTNVYSLVSYDQPAWVFFCESSICLVLEEEDIFDELSEEFVEAELTARSARHFAMIESGKPRILLDVLSIIKEEIDRPDLPVKVNYVFGFSSILRNQRIDEKEKTLLKILSEPSILDMDDMVSSKEYEDRNVIFPPPDHRVFESIRDIDPSSRTTTYITWAAILSYSMEEEAYQRTKHLLICLEARLQATWNRCFVFSEYADQVFEGGADVPHFQEMYWQFVRAFDDAKSAISSTFSSRADTFFRAMVKTSKLLGEIDRLKLKMNLVEKYNETQISRRNSLYQKTIEGLLFIAAIGSVMEVLIPLPLLVDARVGWGVTLVLFVVGLLAILRIR